MLKKSCVIKKRTMKAGMRKRKGNPNFLSCLRRVMHLFAFLSAVLSMVCCLFCIPLSNGLSKIKTTKSTNNNNQEKTPNTANKIPMSTKPKIRPKQSTHTSPPQTNQHSGTPGQPTCHGSEEGYSWELVKLQHITKKRTLEL